MNQINNNQSSILGVIDDFYQKGSASQPVEVLGNLLYNFFANYDAHDEDDDGKPLKAFKAYNEHYVCDLVYTTMGVINFIIKLKEERDFMQKQGK